MNEAVRLGALRDYNVLDTAPEPSWRSARMRFDAEKLPLVRALRGVPSSNVEMMVKTPAFPDGVYLMSTGRPVLDREGTVRAASSACAPRSQRSRNP